MTSSSQSTMCVVEVGGIAVGLRAGNQNFLDSVQRRYMGFLSSSRPEVELDLELVNYGAVSDDDVRVRREASRWIFERGDFRAQWDPGSGRGQVRQSANPYALDSVLRILHSLILAGRGGFLLHAASATCGPERDERARAYLFPGVSGAGKTTLTHLAPPDVVRLSDEVSYVRSVASGYAAFGTPFSGELAQSGANCAAPVAALFFLEKGSTNRIEEMSPSDAARLLMRNILFFAEDRELVDRLFDMACDFVEKVPVRRLTFYPDSRVWEEIRSFEAVAAHV